MFIRIEFEDIDSDSTGNARQIFFSSPNGICLSLNAYAISSDEIRELVGHSVVFWHLDVDVLNKRGGVLTCLNGIMGYLGVRYVDVLPIEGKFEKSDDFMNILMQYVDRSNFI